ncbi:MAG: Bifunctional deaminase-reductase domain protein [Candidatus Wolfebacteria bacterium GW2011_GWC1_37_10]|uniref:Bifunctional deaminase-reductase domain protein n=1 Tax=Candidatus Wolfebacteria bacterium GW2011_GWC1_37_10 TaxID=1619010 RepID=A0A0G0FQR9_9BACT|nr:MAG: Bifunctional deaminase-reductase domain protein [Candidatus Wolfebacteria bacterium GW2011_GWC1_37_10]
MRVILYMAISLNGMIAKSDDDTSWISKEEWDSYSLAVRNAGCLIVGHRTYGILTKQPEFSEFKDVKLVVVAQENFQTLAPNHLVAHSPKESLEILKDFKEVVVAGGGALNASFMEENIVDEIFIDIEPIILGKGIPLFRDKDFELNLKLVGQKKISDNEIQLHYEVLK